MDGGLRDRGRDSQATGRPTAYERLYPICRATGCQGNPKPRSHDCYRHVLVDAF